MNISPDTLGDWTRTSGAGFRRSLRPCDVPLRAHRTARRPALATAGCERVAETERLDERSRAGGCAPERSSGGLEGPVRGLLSLGYVTRGGVAMSHAGCDG